MGIRGLQTFIKTQVPNGIFSINILKEINAFKSNNPGLPVILVFDLWAMLHEVYSNFDPIERLVGGNYQKLFEVFDAFFSELSNAGVELVFFNDGPVHDNKYVTWHNRRDRVYAVDCFIFDSINSKASLGLMVNYRFKKIEFSPSMTPGIFDLVTLCRKYGEYHLAIGMECDTEIAKYANEHSAFAVFGNDSDYFIYDGEWRYWSLKDLNLITNNWRTIEFNKQALRSYLDLNTRQMVLFSIVGGNDAILFDSLKAMHMKIRGLYNNNNNNDINNYNYGKYHFLDISMYVKKYSDTLSDEEIQMLSDDLFSSRSEEHIALIKASIKSYDTTIEQKVTDPILLRAADRNYHFYNILAGLPLGLSIPMYDLRRTDFLPFHEIIFPLLARQVGLIRQHTDNVNTYRQVVETKITHDESYTFVKLIPDYPPLILPTLMELTFEEHDRRYQLLRFKLIKWMIFGDIHSTFEIDEIPKGYMTTVVTLVFLLKIDQITQMEADAFLLAIYRINENIDGTPVPITHINSRTVMIIQLYTNLHNWIASCFSFVGMTKFIDTLVFNGVLFVNVLNFLERIEENSQRYNDVIDDIRFYKNFLRKC